MITMIVRSVPEDLRKAVKVKAAQEEKTMSQFIVEALQAAVAKKGGRG